MAKFRVWISMPFKGVCGSKIPNLWILNHTTSICISTLNACFESFINVDTLCSILWQSFRRGYWCTSEMSVVRKFRTSGEFWTTQPAYVSALLICILHRVYTLMHYLVDCGKDSGVDINALQRCLRFENSEPLQNFEPHNQHMYQHFKCMFCVVLKRWCDM